MSTVTNSYSAFCRSVICEDAKLVLGSIAVLLLLLMVFVGVSLTCCVLKLHPAFNFLILFICMVLLAYLEALHYACVSVEKWNVREYADHYPRAVRCHALVDTSAKVKKFLMGRQFMVILVVFFIAQITTFPGEANCMSVFILTNTFHATLSTYYFSLDIPHDFAGIPEIIMLVFVKSGLPGVAVSLCIGQLVSCPVTEYLQFTVLKNEQYINFLR